MAVHPPETRPVSPTPPEEPSKGKEQKSYLEKMKVPAGLLLAGVAVASAAGWMSANKLNENLENGGNPAPGSGTNTSGSEFPGESEQPNPGQTVEAPEVSPVDPSNPEIPGSESWKFYSDNGQKFQTFEEFSAPIEIAADTHEDSIAAQVAYYKHLENMANNSLAPLDDPTEVISNLNIAEGQQLDGDDYENAAALRFKAYDKLYDTPDGNLYEFAQQLAGQVVKNQLTSEIKGDDAEYRIAIEFAKTKPEFTITDNLGETTLSANTSVAGTYDLTFTGGGPTETITPDGQSVWLVDGDAVVTKREG